MTLSANQLWILHTMVLTQSSTTRAKSLHAQLAVIRREIEADLRAAGEGARLDCTVEAA
jgi:hypothetical protein